MRWGMMIEAVLAHNVNPSTHMKLWGGLDGDEKALVRKLYLAVQRDTKVVADILQAMSEQES